MKRTTGSESKRMAMAILSVLREGAKALKAKQTKGLIARRGEGMGVQGNTQTLTEADVFMQVWLSGECRESLDFLQGLQFEGEPAHWFSGTPGGRLLFIDEIDGSQNQLICDTQLLHSAVATLVEVPAEGDPLFRDIVAGVMLSYLDGAMVYASRQDDNSYATVVFGNLENLELPRRPKLLTEGLNRLDIGNYLFLSDPYYPPVRELVGRLFAGRKGNLRSLGNSAWESLYASLGYATGYVSTQKHDEVGAMWAIARGAGASASTFNGTPHDDLPLPIGKKGTVELVIGPTQEIGRHIVDLIQADLA